MSSQPTEHTPHSDEVLLETVASVSEDEAPNAIIDTSTDKSLDTLVPSDAITSELIASDAIASEVIASDTLVSEALVSDALIVDDTPLFADSDVLLDEAAVIADGDADERLLADMAIIDDAIIEDETNDAIITDLIADPSLETAALQALVEDSQHISSETTHALFTDARSTEEMVTQQARVDDLPDQAILAEDTISDKSAAENEAITAALAFKTIDPDVASDAILLEETDLEHPTPIQEPIPAEALFADAPLQDASTHTTHSTTQHVAIDEIHAITDQALFNDTSATTDEIALFADENAILASDASHQHPVADSHALTESHQDTPALVSPLEAVSQDHEFGTLASQHITSDAQDNHSTVSQEIDRQGFQLGSLNVMVGFIDASELTDMPHTYRLPNTPDWFIGYSNLHGNLIPIFDLSQYFDISQQEDSPQIQHKQKILVIGHGEDAAGILIDSVPQRLKIPETQVTNINIAPETMQAHLLNAYEQDDHIWFDLNVYSLLDALEQDITT